MERRWVIGVVGDVELAAIYSDKGNFPIELQHQMAEGIWEKFCSLLNERRGRWIRPPPDIL